MNNTYQQVQYNNHIYALSHISRRVNFPDKKIKRQNISNVNDLRRVCNNDVLKLPRLDCKKTF